MPALGSLDGTLPELQALYYALVARLSPLGVSVQINDYGGFRTEADTSAILAARQTDYAHAVASGAIPSSESLDQFRAIAPYGESWHDYGAALDLSPLAWPSTETQSTAQAQLVAAAEAVGFAHPLPASDPAHFTLPVSLAQAKSLYQQYYGSDPVAAAFVGDANRSWWRVVLVGGVVAFGVWLASRSRRTYDTE